MPARFRLDARTITTGIAIGVGVGSLFLIAQRLLPELTSDGRKKSASPDSMDASFINRHRNMRSRLRDQADSLGIMYASPDMAPAQVTPEEVLDQVISHTANDLSASPDNVTLQDPEIRDYVIKHHFQTLTAIAKLQSEVGEQDKAVKAALHKLSLKVMTAFDIPAKKEAKYDKPQRMVRIISPGPSPLFIAGR